ncbi:hypothetical protein Acsp05_07660 [Actinokineospora sp. NBRC 105648]|nr:hypothetical protein Acsp05_07660 [Actinokineospora sp. NBRC 105648]
MRHAVPSDALATCEKPGRYQLRRSGRHPPTPASNANSLAVAVEFDTRTACDTTYDLSIGTLHGCYVYTLTNAERYSSFREKPAVVIRDIADGRMYNNGNKQPSGTGCPTSTQRMTRRPPTPV